MKKTQETVRAAAAPTLEMFRKAGVFELSEVRKAFEDLNLLKTGEKK